MIAPQKKTSMQFDLPSGTMLGKYEILRKLAMGGMAEIYLARVRGTAGFEKLVVIKRILPTVADDPTFVRMFLDEARLAATLQHPNIADVHEVGEHEGSPFFTMEFIHGQDVRTIKMTARERKERIPLAIALAIVHGTASALDYAHDRTGPDGKNMGLVHRDVSSSNILVGYEGAIKLIDFGIARATSRSHQTQTGTLKGKIPYMSPEQCRGMPLDRRSDLFSLGVVMYELTAGRRPFHGENDFAVMDQIVHQGAPPPSTLIKGYPPELEAIVLKLLARKAEDRYQTAEEMLHDLDPFLASNRLWVSPKPLSRYMRTVFADAMAAWDQALEQGVSLADHVTRITSQSKNSELMTPPSSFPAVLPLSQEMPAVAAPPGTSEFGAVTPAGLAGGEAKVTPRPFTSQPVQLAEPEYPKLKRSGAGVGFLLVGLVALGIGGYFGLTMMQKAKEPAAAAGSAEVEPARPMNETTEVTAPVEAVGAKPADPVETKPPVEEKKEKVIEAKPEVQEPEVQEPEVQEPEVQEPAKVVKHAKAQKQKTPVKQKKVEPAKEVKEVKEPKETPKPPPKDPPKEAKEKWDPNSPFLPQ